MVMSNIKMCDYTCSEGTYLLPRIESGTENRFAYLYSSFISCGSEMSKTVCEKGEDALRGLSLRLGTVENAFGADLTNIFVGIYRIGERMPVWQEVLDYGTDFKMDVELELDDVTLACGRYFLLFGNIRPSGDALPYAVEFAGCYRQDFAVLPGAGAVDRPMVTACAIEYVAPGKRGKDGPNSFLARVGGFPLYKLTVTLDRTPDLIRDRFDLRTFDEGLRCCDTLSDVFRQPTEELLFVPPHGVPHGTSHFILYHNDEPFVHFSCNRNVRFGPLRMEYLTPDSLYWHLLDNETLRSYCCRAIKGKLLRYLTQPDLPTPECLALGNDYGFWLSCILEDLYVGMPRRSPVVTQDFEDLVSSQTEPCVFVVSDWENWPEERLAEWIACMERHARGGSHRWVFSGKSRDVKALLAKHASLSRLIPAEHRWYTDPLTKMERLYVAIDNDSNGDLLPSFTRYESLYTQIVTPTSR